MATKKRTRAQKAETRKERKAFWKARPSKARPLLRETRPAVWKDFSAQPLECRALRLALGWTTAELGHYMGLRFERYKSFSVIAWENARFKPSKLHRQMLVELLRVCYPEYLKKLGELKKHENASKITAKVVYRTPETPRTPESTLGTDRNPVGEPEPYLSVLLHGYGW